ncbi:hypothetical protein ACFPIJ_26010 [Dactylosporangium cerinum]|uniref:NACHT domain-containing protein n=1 Tax=Dactylosporangium cerinum TaxID=1434730 RepID=A0ABV9VYV0_9ACTN
MAVLRPVRSAYLEQVRRIAPPQLLDRDAELAELAGFCTDALRGPYVWWRAGPWAGKSALLSTFVLHPPPQLAGRARTVSFFITARLAAQDTREAFTTVLLEQLCELTGQDLPSSGSEATREACLLELLSQAAAVCAAAGERLVLLVDGLDEDRGETVGPHAHSIAGLLPANPPAGMRIIVAGRPNPPIPDDVSSWHPLRDPGIIRLLGDSPHARDLQRLGQTELKRLLKGSPVEQDLLGLLTAARGGLSGRDLHELTGADLVHIEDVLHTVAGRTFTRRADHWNPDTGPEIYLLGHEELHTAACHYLGKTRLADYRNRLHAWADTYRTSTPDQPAWPPDTPRYLLSGYTRMLHTIEDTDRLVTLAADPVRHNRMLDLSGGDAAALTEVKAAQDLVMTQPGPDLHALVRLSVERNNLIDRNTNIPPELPALWAKVQRPNRAEALARSITAPYWQVRALTGVASALATAGEHTRAVTIAAEAEQLAHSITDPDSQARALTDIASALATAGEHTRAATIARSITHPDSQARALTEIASALATAGEHTRAVTIAAEAEQLAHSITDPDSQTEALTDVASALATAGDHTRAATIARSIIDPYWQARALTDVASALATAGEHTRAAKIAAEAEQAAHTITAPHWQALALTDIASALATAGAHTRAAKIADEAEQAVRSITDPYSQARALTGIAGTLATAGEHTRAVTIATEAEQAAHTITDPYSQALALTGIAGTLATAGAHIRAEQAARSITDPYWQVRALTDIAGTLATAGEHTRAATIAAEVEQIARSITYPDSQARALTDIASALATAGEHTRAVTIATEAEQAAHTITDPNSQTRALTDIASALATAGEHTRAATIATEAEQLARSITDPLWQVRALTDVASALATAGEHTRAAKIAAEAEQAAHTITDPHWQPLALTGVAHALATTGDHARAEQAAHSITDPYWRALALTDVASALANAGEHTRAVMIATEAEQAAHTITDPNSQTRALTGVASVLATAGDRTRAEQAAHSITDLYWQALALTDVVVTCEPAKARPLIAAALVLGPWTTCLQALARIDPAALATLVNHHQRSG